MSNSKGRGPSYTKDGVVFTSQGCPVWKLMLSNPRLTREQAIRIVAQNARSKSYYSK